MKISKVEPQVPGRPPAPPSASRGCVVISGAQRDALYSFLMDRLGELGDLERVSRSDDVEACYRLGRRVTDALRLLVDGRLGWGETSGEEEVPLALPPDDLRRILSDMRQSAINLREAIRPEYEDKRDEWEKATLVHDACAVGLEQLARTAE